MRAVAPVGFALGRFAVLRNFLSLLRTASIRAAITPTAVALQFLLMTAAPALAGEVASGESGAVLYARYCASCHGTTGRGDGEDAPFFQPRPSDLRGGILEKYPTDELARRVRTGTPLTIGVDVAALRRQANQVEDLVAHMKRLPATDWRSVNEGWDLYADRCQKCHGPTGEAETLPRGVKAPRTLSSSDFQKAIGQDELIEAVRHGRQGMPGLTPRVTIEEGRRIAAFVRILSPGFTLYTRYCANCHADDGRGVHSLGEVLGEELALPAVVFDQSFFATHSREELRKAVWHMLSTHQPQMPHFRYLLTQAQLESIVAYLKRTEARK